MYIRIFKCYQYVNNYYLITNTDQICNTITIMGSIVSGISKETYKCSIHDQISVYIKTYNTLVNT